MRYKKESIVAAIIYMACKEENVPRTFKEISKKPKYQRKRYVSIIARSTKYFPKALDVLLQLIWWYVYHY